MASFTLSLKSDALGGQTSVSVVLPVFEDMESEIRAGERFQTLWLLHGGGGDHTDYLRKTAIEHWAVRHKLAVVMPEVGNSFYNDLPDGPQCYAYVVDELPRLLRKHFPLSDLREDNFIAGLSMGGFGAAKCAFNHPERYAAVALMSTGPVGPHQLARLFPQDDARFERTFGKMDAIPGTANDVWHVLEQAMAAKVALPRIYDCCGTEDFAYEHFQAFRTFAEGIGVPVTYAEWPGTHSWDFWNEALPRIIDWLPLKERGFVDRLGKERFARMMAQRAERTKDETTEGKTGG